MQLGWAHAKGIDFWCGDRRCDSGNCLAKVGFDVTVVDQAADRRSSGSPVDVRGPAVEVAERMGVMAQIREADTGVRDMVFVNARGRVVSRVDMRSTWAEPGDVELSRGELAAILRDAVPRRRRVRVRQRRDRARTRTRDGVDGRVRSRVPRAGSTSSSAPTARTQECARWPSGPRPTTSNTLASTSRRCRWTARRAPDLVMYNTPGRAVAIHPAGGHPGAAFMFRAPQIPQFDHRDIDQHKRLLC